MHNIGRERQEISPFSQLLILIGYAIAGVFLFTIIAIVIIIAVYGMDAVRNMMTMQISDKNLGPLKILQLASTMGIFLAPPIGLALTERISVGRFYGFKRPKMSLLGITLLLMVVSMPVMEWTVLINQKMVLPDFLKPAEDWMKAKEDEAMQMTYAFLKVKGILDLILNFVMIALIPGIAEELMFRGGIQRTFLRMFGNPHVAIWTAAFLFSAIHLQFYGFLPRMLLGAGFGYIYFWSGSLWYAMFAHFLNNSYAVATAYYMQVHNMPLADTDKTIDVPWYGYAISLVLTVAIFHLFKIKAQENDGERVG